MAMTRKEAEEAIMEKLKEIREIALAYAPDRDHVGMFIIKEHCNVMNYAKREETDGVLDCFEVVGDGKGMFSCPHGGGEDA